LAALKVICWWERFSIAIYMEKDLTAQNRIYRKAQLGLDELPGRSGDFSRNLCNVHMGIDVAKSEKIKFNEQNASGRVIRYCRLCESACPVGMG
jgi:epoxyqueuosine reductase